ncbi:MAG: hypothetical protein ACBR20_23425 [Microcoleus sp.]
MLARGGRDPLRRLRWLDGGCKGRSGDRHSCGCHSFWGVNLLRR